MFRNVDALGGASHIFDKGDTFFIFHIFFPALQAPSEKKVWRQTILIEFLPLKIYRFALKL